MNLTGVHRSSGMPAGSLIDPVLLFFLALMSATLVVIVPSNPRFGEADPDAKVPAPVATPTVANPAVESVAQEMRSLAAEITAVRTRLQQLRFDVARLDALARQRSTPAPSPGVSEPSEPSSELSGLQQLIRDKRQELSRLTIDFDKAVPPVGRTPRSSPVTLESTKEVVVFGLVHNRVLPLDDEYYTKVSGTLPSGTKVVVATPRKMGETGTEIQQAGSAFQRRLQAIVPAKESVLFVVDNGSFAVFRQAREIARERRLDVGWNPSTTDDGRLLFGSRGIKVDPQGTAR